MSSGQRQADRLAWASALLAPPLFGLLALAFGQDANWDLRNYHFYNPYAFLNGRFGYDIAPAQLPTFYNPLLHVPFYWLVNALPPRGTGFVLGTVQGLNFVLLLLAARAVLGPALRWTAPVLALLGMAGAGGLSLLGTSFFDNVLTLFFLGSLVLLLRGHDRLLRGPLVDALWLAAGAGLVMGLAVGLKQTMAIYALGLCLACLFLSADWRRTLTVAFVFGCGVLLGIVVTGGFWIWLLYQRYGNPLFPHMNSLFQAPLAPLTDRRDPAFLPQSLWEALLYPFVFAFDSRRVGEIAFTELRIALLYALLPLAVLWRARPTLSDAGRSRMILAAVAVTYVVWLGMFSIYRYLVGVEMLAPLAILLCLDRLPLGRLRVPAALAAALAILLVLQPGQWERVKWTDGRDYFGVEPPVFEQPARTLVLMAGWQPTSFVIPRLPRDLRFLRIQSNFTSPGDEENGFNDLMRGIVERHRGPLVLLVKDHELRDAAGALATYQAKIDTAACRPLPTHLDRQLLLCPLLREEKRSSFSALSGETNHHE